MKRGQVTLLVIIGIILLFSVSMMLYFSRVTYTDRLQSQARESVNEFIETNSLSQYITTCLQRVANEGLVLIGEQGGVIYESQGGLTRTQVPNDRGRTHLNYIGLDGEQNISFGIQDISQTQCGNYVPDQQGTDDFNIDENRNWEYPVRELKLDDYIDRFESSVEPGCITTTANKDLRKSGYLGFNRFPKLCVPESIDTYTNFLSGKLACGPTFLEDPNWETTDQLPSIERQLETFIENNMPNCFDLSIYEKQGDEISVDIEHADVDIYFIDPKGILIQSHFPFEISLKGNKPIVEIVDFQQHIDFNFVDTYRLAYDILQEMSRNPYFDFEEGYKNLPNYKPKLEAELIEHPPSDCPTCSPQDLRLDDVLIITNVDDEEKLAGKPYVFSTALSQRRPVLEFIDDPTQQFSLVDVDFVRNQGDILEFEVAAIDPNDDDITVTISGWKQTEDTILDTVCCSTSLQGCTITDHDHCLITTENYPRLDFDLCREAYPQGCNIETLRTTNEFNLVDSTASNQPNLLQPQLDEGDGLISYYIKETDVGFHDILVQVEDEHGAIDFQNIRILVFDIPVPLLELSNPYDDIDDSYASYEDPYVLDAKKSIPSAFAENDQISDYLYRIYYDGDNDADNEYLTIKNVLTFPEYEYTITTIQDQNFTEENYTYNFGTDLQGTLRTTLEVRQFVDDQLIPSPESEPQEIYLSECLPHGYRAVSEGSTDNLLSHYVTQPYEDGQPYFSSYASILNQEDIFYLPHVCCEPNDLSTTIITPGVPGLTSAQLGGGSFASETTLCYDNREYQTCYPPQDSTNFAQQLLKGALYENSDGELAYVDAASLVSSVPIGVPDPYQITTSGGTQRLGDAINDIYVLSHQQYCSGDRGTVCSGDIVLDWDRVIECEDVFTLPDQYARCEGPGLPADATSQPEFISSISPLASRYLGEGFREYTYSCQGNDATYTFGIDLSCESYDGRQNFEKNVLRVSETNSVGFDEDTARHIDEGFCAGPQPSSVTGFGSGAVITYDASSPYDCFANCEDGGCEYSSATYCFCSERTACGTGRYGQKPSVQDFVYTDTAFSCNRATGNACNSDCVEYLPTDAQSCYCQNNPYAGRVRNSQFSAFTDYFDDSTGTWNANTACCSAPGDFATLQKGVPGTSGAAVCYDGKSYASNSRFGSTVTPSFLSYQGKVYFCGTTGSTVDELRNTENNQYIEDYISFGDTVAGSAYTCTSAGWQ